MGTSERDHLVAELVAAYEAGKLSGETLDLGRRIATALSTTLPALGALRVHLQADGREMVSRIRKVATAVPDLHQLANWI